jgi:hypothetical protein
MAFEQAFNRGELIGPLGIDRGRRDKFGALSNLLNEGVNFRAHLQSSNVRSLGSSGTGPSWHSQSAVMRAALE